MKNHTDHDRLLDDVVEEAMPTGFREQALGRTLAAVRQQRRRRQAFSLAVPLAVAGLAIALWNIQDRPTTQPSTLPIESIPILGIVTSQPLVPDEIVHTDSGSVVLLSSAPGNLASVTDQPESSLVRILDDEGLLQLVAGRGAALVEVSPDQFTLVFANPADMKGFRLP